MITAVFVVFTFIAKKEREGEKLKGSANRTLSKLRMIARIVL